MKTSKDVCESKKSETKNIKMRRCVSCRKIFHKSEFLRVVKTPDKNFEIDFSGKAQGRGAYICKSPDCAANAKKRRQFDRSFKQKVPDELYEKIISVIDNQNVE